MKKEQMTPIQKHNRNNRVRRTPRRVRQLRSEANSLDARCATIEDSDITPEEKEQAIKNLRKSAGPILAQINRLLDRAGELA